MFWNIYISKMTLVTDLEWEKGFELSFEPSFHKTFLLQWRRQPESAIVAEMMTIASELLHVSIM